MDVPFALFLDFDGTLVEIAPHPDGVQVEPGLTDTLTKLRHRLGGALALVSGRSVAVLDRHLGAGAFDAAGLHGIERRLAGTFRGCRPEDHPDLRAGIRCLQDLFAPDPRIVVEDKGCSVAVHWRLAPEREDEARGAAVTEAARLGPDYRIQFGKAVAEILPAGSGKGRAIDAFLHAEPYRGRRPVFIGDDLTDEHGFGVVNEAGGISVRVGPGDTVAALRLASPAALRQALSAWAESGRNPFAAETPSPLRDPNLTEPRPHP